VRHCGGPAHFGGDDGRLHQDVRESDLFYPRSFQPLPDTVTRRNVRFRAPDSTELRGWLLTPPRPRERR